MGGMAGKDPMEAELRQRRVETFASAYMAAAKDRPTDKRGRPNRLAVAFACRAIGQAGGAKGPGTVQVTDQDVKAALAVVVSRLGVKYAKNAQDTLEELALVAHSDIRDYFEEEADGGLRLKRLHGMGKESRAIKTIKHKHRVFHHKAADTTEEVHEYEYEFWDKLTALRVLAEYHKLINSPRKDGDNSRERVIVVLPANGFEGQVPKTAQFEDITGMTGAKVVVEERRIGADAQVSQE